MIRLEDIESKSPYSLSDLNLTDAKCGDCEGPMVSKLRTYTHVAGRFRFEASEVPALSCVTRSEPECGGDYYPGEISVAMNRQVIIGLQLIGEQKLAYGVQLKRKGLAESLAIKGSGLVIPPSPR